MESGNGVSPSPKRGTTDPIANFYDQNWPRKGTFLWITGLDLWPWVILTICAQTTFKLGLLSVFFWQCEPCKYVYSLLTPRPRSPKLCHILNIHVSLLFSVLIDKDGKPKWDPATLEGVTQEKVDWYFSPLPEGHDLMLWCSAKISNGFYQYWNTHAAGCRALILEILTWTIKTKHFV